MKTITWSPLRNWGGESRREDARNCYFIKVTVPHDEWQDMLPDLEMSLMTNGDTQLLKQCVTKSKISCVSN